MDSYTYVVASAPLSCPFFSPHTNVLVLSMSERRQHFQGLQLPNGELPRRWETHVWLGAFLFREAILVCPDNLNESEQAFYCNAIGNALVSGVQHINPTL